MALFSIITALCRTMECRRNSQKCPIVCSCSGQHQTAAKKPSELRLHLSLLCSPELIFSSANSRISTRTVIWHWPWRRRAYTEIKFETEPKRMGTSEAAETSNGRKTKVRIKKRIHSMENATSNREPMCTSSYLPCVVWFWLTSCYRWCSELHYMLEYRFYYSIYVLFLHMVQ